MRTANVTKLLALLAYPALLAGTAFTLFMTSREHTPDLTGMTAEYALRRDGVSAAYAAFFFAAMQPGYLIGVIPLARRVKRAPTRRVTMFAGAAAAGAIAVVWLGMRVAELTSRILPAGKTDTVLFFLIPLAAPIAAVWASRRILGRAASTIASPADVH